MWNTTFSGRCVGVLGLALAIGLSACSSDGSREAAVPADVIGADAPVATRPGEPAPLAGIRLASSSAAQLDRVAVDGIPTGVDAASLTLRVDLPGGGAALLPVIGDGAAWHVVAPLHPEDPLAGGVVTVSFIDGPSGDPIGRPFELDLEPIPPAVGAWDALVAHLTAELDSRARRLGSSVDELAATSFDDVAPHLLALKVVQGYLDDGSDHDLESLADDAELSADDRALLDALVARLDPAVLNPALPDLADDGADDAIDAGLVDDPAGAEAHGAGPVGWRRPPAQVVPCVDGGPAIGNADELSRYMRIGSSAEVRDGGAVAKLGADVGAVIEIAGKVPKLQAAATAVGAALGVGGVLREATASLMPSELVSLSASISHERFDEDYTTNGTWSRVRVVASSNGYTADAALVGMLNWVVDQGAGKISGGLPADDQLAVELGGKLRSSATGTYVERRQDSLLTFCPQQWTVDVTGEPFSTARALVGNLQVDADSSSYWPVRVGSDVLRIEVRGDRFAGQSVSVESAVEVKEIIVDTTPDLIVVDRTGEVIVIEAGIENAESKVLEWRPERGAWVDGLGDRTDGPAARTLEAPGDPSDYPFNVVVESMTRTGLRETGDPPRLDITTVRLADLIVEPDPGQVQVGGELQFTATRRDGTPVSVTWSATGGRIGRATGLYVAGELPGTYAVTATLQEDPSIRATAVVQVVEDGGCAVGTWRLREQAYLDQLVATTGQPGARFEHRSGEYVVVLGEDGTATGYRRAWTFAVVTGEGTLVTEINSIDPGTWSVVDDRMSVSMSGSGARVSVGIEIDGRLIAAPLGDRQVGGDAWSGTGTYRCEGDRLEVTAGGITATFDRAAPP